jgi:hypothetical protein
MDDRERAKRGASEIWMDDCVARSAKQARS